MSLNIRMAQVSDAETVTDLVHALLSELTLTGSEPPTRDEIKLSTMTILSERNGVWALLAEDDQQGAAGVLTLNECEAIYAGGKFGEIAELYVVSQFRTDGVGRNLIEEAIKFARDRKWGRLEVGAPDVPRWNRTVSFYRKNGFSEVGPRLQLLLQGNDR
ncbi:MAG: N-acetyltransferase family protein [Woeseiales bacterium]